MEEDLIKLVSQFQIQGKVSEVKALGGGFINDTFKVFVDSESNPRYLLQRKNHDVFPDVPAMMQNIQNVTTYIKSISGDDPERATLTVIPAKNGELYIKDSKGNFWAMCLYIGGTMCYDRADNTSLAYEGGLGLGKFHSQVSGYKGSLTEIIKGFHNMRWRFSQWDESLKKDKAGRVSSLSEEISWIESRRERMLSFWKMFEEGIIPTRVIHGDTKISNFLFDSESGDLVCAIDLDTMMSSTLLADTGDALRSYTNTGAEDEKDLSKVSMSMDMFKSYISGYMSVMKDFLTETEKDYLAFSGCYITYEQVLRFLMDYIDGDTYYKIAYPSHNLVRTKAQYKLLCSMEEQLEQAEAFVKSL